MGKWGTRTEPLEPNSFLRDVNVQSPFDEAAMTAQLLSGVWLDKSSVLGEGAFGVVYKGTLGDTPVAIKTIKANSPEQAAELESTLLEEAAVWASVQHPNVVQFYGVHKSDDGGLYLVSELMDGSVEGLLHEEEERVCDGDEPLLDSRQKLTMCLHVACALQRLHQLGILHSDLAARNVLYKREVGGGRTYKVTDFGLATVGMGTGAGSSASKSYQLVSREKLPVRWCSPEVLKRQLYSVEADIWSMGVYMWEVFSLAELPYGLHLTNTDIFQKIAPAKSTFRLDQPEECPDDVYAMMHKCWIFGRKQRIPLKQLEADLRQRRNSIPQPASQPASPAVQRPPAAPAARPAAPAAPGRVAAPPARAPSPARVPRPPPAPGKASAGPPPPPPGPVTGGRVQRRSSLPGSQGQGALLNAVRNARGSTSTSAAPPPASSPAADEKKARVMMAEGKAAREAESYHRAVTLFRQAEKLGSTEAVAELGRCYSAGWGVERDPAMALKLLRQAEKHGEPVALHCLGFLYSVGEGVLKEDQFKAASYWEAAAKKGLAVAHHNLGWMYANGKGPYTVDKKKAFEEYSIAAEGGYGKALAEVGRWYMSGITVPVNYAKAKQFFEKATEKRQGLAFYHLGVMYDNAWGVPKDHLQALRYYRSGDEIGDVTCKYAIGACYEKGRGTATDTATARRYYREADEKGETLASFRLGEIYFYGESGVDIDYQKSLEYLKKCSPSETPGMNYYYGMAYSLGKGRPVDLKKAIAYFEAGAKGQVGECAVALAEMYFEGRGVTRSTQRYKDYLLQGEKMGSDDASTQLALMYQDGFHGESTDLKKALVHFKRGAENGSSACKAKVAIMWLEGLTDENVPVSKIQQQLMEAAEEGSSLAHEALSRHHLPEGRLQTDPELAFKHLKIAADLGHEGCGSALAQRLLAGIGCRRDAAAAAAILKPLAEAGDEDANRDLALLYVRGDGVTKDCLKAFELFSKARPNDPIAEFEMGKMFATGDGGMKMKSQAKFYLEKAAKAGNHEAAAYLEEMRSSKKKKGSRLPWKR